MRCIICGLEKEASKEHIIPEAMGNKKFVTYKVCQECNNKLGTNVDNYLTDYIITKMIRKDLGVLGKEEKEIKIFPSSASDINGENFVFRNDVPSITPKVEMKDNVLHIEAETFKEAYKLVQKKLERCGYTNEKIKEILKNSKENAVKRQPVFQISADIDVRRYLLAGIKIAYEFACEVLDDIYFDDYIAKIFRKELYKAVNSNRNTLSTSVDYCTIKKYAAVIPKEAIEIKEKVKHHMNDLTPPGRHMCLLHSSVDNKLICQVILFLENIMSFTVILSKDAAKYKMNGKYKFAIVLENGDVIII